MKAVWVFGRFWNRTELNFSSKPGPLDGYQDPVLTLAESDSALLSSRGAWEYFEVVGSTGEVAWNDSEVCVRFAD